MTQEHITITEEVQKDGQIVTQTRETLQTTVETPEQIAGRQAMGVTHPDYIPASEREYTYNEATGMSESKPREEVELVESPETEELGDELEPLDEPEPVTDEEMEQSTSTDYQPMTEPDGICGHSVGNGECQLEVGHSGAHKLNVD